MSYYPIELEKSRNFRYGMRAISTIEKKFKKPVTQIDMSKLTIDDMAILMWAGLVHEDNKLTPDKLMDLIDDYSNMAEVMKVMQEAFKAAFVVEEELEDEEVIAEEKND